MGFPMLLEDPLTIAVDLSLDKIYKEDLAMTLFLAGIDVQDESNLDTSLEVIPETLHNVSTLEWVSFPYHEVQHPWDKEGIAEEEAQ